MAETVTPAPAPANRPVSGSPGSNPVKADLGLVKPGDVLINTCELTTITEQVLNLKDYLVEIHIYEDIFSPALHGQIVIRDSRNLIGNLPIVGDEVLTLDIQTPGFGEPSEFDPVNKIQKSFAVYAIRDRKLSSDREQLYVLYFCSLEAMMDNVTKLSQRYTGTTDEIASEIYEKNIRLPRLFTNKIQLPEGEGTNLYISDAPHESKLTVLPAMWSPMQTMSWLAKRSLGAKLKSPTYLFYETTTAFYFTSIESLIVNQIEESGVYSDYIYQTNLNNLSDATAISKGYQTVEAIKFLTNLDILQGQDLGHFASNLYSFDMVKKKVDSHIYDHGMAFPEYKHMESYKQTGKEKPVFDETKKFNMIYPITVVRSGNSKTLIETTHPGLFGGTDDTIDLHPEKYTQQRLSSLMDISTLRMQITVPGRCDAEVGKLINFYYPSVGDKTKSTGETEIWDKFISGIYMITSIHHQITPFHHNMYMEISKDSYFTPIYPDAKEEGGTA